MKPLCRWRKGEMCGLEGWRKWKIDDIEGEEMKLNLKKNVIAGETTKKQVKCDEKY